LLDALAEAEGIGVSQDEFSERILYNAQRFGMAPNDYFQRLQENNQLGSIFADVRRGKALAGVVGQAVITDSAGTRLDIDELFGVEEVADDQVEYLEALEAAETVDADDADVVPGADGTEVEDAERV
jgi:trigger factor